MSRVALNVRAVAQAGLCCVTRRAPLCAFIPIVFPWSVFHKLKETENAWSQIPPEVHLSFTQMHLATTLHSSGLTLVCTLFIELLSCPLFVSLSSGAAFADFSIIVVQVLLIDAFTAVDAHICHGNHIMIPVTMLDNCRPTLFA